MLSALRAFRITDAIDILLVAVVLYRVFVMFKETRAIQMLLGLGGLTVASFGASIPAQTTAGLIVRAVQLVQGVNVPMDSFASEAAARAYLERQRQVRRTAAAS